MRSQKWQSSWSYVKRRITIADENLFNFAIKVQRKIFSLLLAIIYFSLRKIGIPRITGLIFVLGKWNSNPTES